MAIRTARGTASLKTSGTTLTVASFTLPAGHSLQVGIGCENSFGPPTGVTINGRPLKRKANVNNATGSLNSSMWIKARAAVAQTGTLVATWSSAINARAMWASSLDETMRLDQSQSQADAPTTTPNTGTTATLASPIDYAVCSFASKGPSGDTAATGQQIRDGGTLTTATLGQRVGTTGAAATTNVTVQETFLQLSAVNATEGNLSGVTSRRWANCILALQGTLETHASMGSSDILEVRTIFDGKITPIPHEQMAWFYNEGLDRWEVYDRGADMELETLIAYYTVGTGWTEV